MKLTLCFLSTFLAVVPSISADPQYQHLEQNSQAIIRAIRTFTSLGESQVKIH